MDFFAVLEQVRYIFTARVLLLGNLYNSTRLLVTDTVAHTYPITTYSLSGTNPFMAKLSFFE